MVDSPHIWSTIACIGNDGSLTRLFRDPSKFPYDVGNEVWLDRAPSYLATDAFLEHFTEDERDDVKKTRFVLRTEEYPAPGALGVSFDGSEKGPSHERLSSDRVIFALISLWLSKPNTLYWHCIALHVQDVDSEPRWRQSGTLGYVEIAERRPELLNEEDLAWARAMNSELGKVPRLGLLWNALWFLHLALRESVAETRHVLIWIVLECLFGEPDAELTLRLQMRISKFLSDDPEERHKIASAIKASYELRSAIVHGNFRSRSSSKTGKYSAIATTTEDIVRRVFARILVRPSAVAIFEDVKKRKAYLDNLVFS